MGKNITIYDIAKKSGFSHNTVSQALRNLPTVKEATRLRVLEIASSLGYRPNHLAASLRKGSSRNIALVTPRNGDMKLGFFHELQKQLNANEYEVVLHPLLSESGKQMVFEHVLQSEYDGLITFLFSYSQFSPFEQAYFRRHLPVVVVGMPEDFKSTTGVISFNWMDLTGLQDALNALRKLGHTRILHAIDSHLTSSRQNKLIQAFTHEIGTRDWNSELLLEAGSPTGMAEGYQLASRLVKERPEATAIQCPNDYFAIGLIRGLHELGIEVPRDISVIGSDNGTICKYMRTTLSSIEVGDKDAIPQMVSALLEHLKQNEWDGLQNHFELKSTFYQRESIGSARSETFLRPKEK